MDSASSEGELPITAPTEGSYSSQQLVGLNHLRSKLLNRHHSINIVKEARDMHLLKRFISKEAKNEISLFLDDIIKEPAKQGIQQEALMEIVGSRNQKILRHSLGIWLERLTTVINSSEKKFKVIQEALSWAVVNLDNDSMVTILEVAELEDKELMARLKSDDELMITLAVENNQDGACALFRKGFEIHLSPEDLTDIQNLISVNGPIVNSMHLLYLFKSSTFSICFGNKHPDLKQEFELKSLKVRENRRNQDPLGRFRKIKAYASSLYISLMYLNTEDVEGVEGVQARKDQDPLRKLFACKSYAFYCSQIYDRQMMTEFQLIGQDCTKFACKILDLPLSFDEVKILLNHCTHGDDCERLDQCEDSNFNVALMEGHKTFVAHYKVQQFLWDKMTGDNRDWFNYFVYWKLLLIPAYLLLFFLFPFVIVADLFREADILFVAPPKYQMEGVRDLIRNTIEQPVFVGFNDIESQVERRQEQRFFRFFRRKIHRPFFRIFFHVVIEIIFITFLVLSLVDPRDVKGEKGVKYYDIVSGIFIFFLLLDNILEVRRLKWKFVSSFFWNTYTISYLVLYSIGLSLQIRDGFTTSINQFIAMCYSSQYLTAVSLMIEPIHYRYIDEDNDFRQNWSGNHPINVGVALMAVSSTMAMVGFIKWFLLIRSVGIVIISIVRAFKDVLVMFGLFMIFFISFSVSIYALYKTYIGDKDHFPEQTFSTFTKTSSALFWRFFDPGHPEDIEIRRNFTLEEIVSKINKTKFIGEFNDEEEYLRNLTVIANCTLNIPNFSELENYDLNPEEIRNGTHNLGFVQVIGASYWATYQGIVAIIMMTILIARMTSNYNEITQNAEMEWKYTRSFIFAKFLPTQAALPPPFRLFYYLAYWVRWIKKKNPVVSVREKHYEKSYRDQMAKYYDLMYRLIKLNLQIERERSPETYLVFQKMCFNSIIKNQKHLEANLELLREEIQREFRWSYSRARFSSAR